MGDMHELLDREAEGFSPSPDWLAPTLERVERRRRRRRRATTALSLVLATASLLLVMRAFATEPPIRPAVDPDPNYRFHDVTVRPGEGPGQVLVFYGMSYESYPGVHECTWRALGQGGAVVGQRTELWAHQGQLPDADANAVGMATSGPAHSGEAFCDPQRLDTPGIADAEPFRSPEPGIGIDIEGRVEEWAAAFGLREMSRRQLEANLIALHAAYVQMVETELDDDDWAGWLRFHELRKRMAFIEALLHPQQEAGDEPEGSGNPGPQGSGGPPDDRFMLAEGEEAGNHWELFVMEADGRPVLGHAGDVDGWGYSEVDSIDVCEIESDTINWWYLDPAGGYSVASPPERIVVLQFHAVPPEVGSVTFRMSDGRSLPARMIRIPDDVAPWDAFVIVFEAPVDVEVEEIVIEAVDGTRLDDPAHC
jgi:hypothetical protein